MFNEQQLKNILTCAGILSEEDFDKLSREARENDKKIEDILAEKKIMSSEDSPRRLRNISSCLSSTSRSRPSAKRR